MTNSNRPVTSLPCCLDPLEAAVHDLLVNFWHEPLRARAYGLARELSAGCPVCGFKESSPLLRSLQSMLSLTAEDTRGIQSFMAERLRELVGLLKEPPHRASA